jgi:predicted alpha/beta-hydrolase family hydrolase
MPDRMPVLIDDARKTIDVLRREVAPEADTLVLGGRSMGGRVASMLAAEGFPAGALIFLGYPLHPAGRPEKLRDAHLADVRCPMLFMQGDRDSLCDLALLRPVIERLGSRATLVSFEGADHSLRSVPADILAHTALEWTKRNLAR